MNRFIAWALFIAGGISFLAAGERIAHALNCDTGSEQEDFFCVFAHQVNPVMTGLYACGWDPNGECNPVAHSNCGFTGFGIARAGYCCYDWAPDPSVKFYCTEDFGTTFVVVYWYESTCILETGLCRCEWWIDLDIPWQYAEVCTCINRTVGG